MTDGCIEWHHWHGAAVFRRGFSVSALKILVALIINALHVMQTRYCDEYSVCLSVCHTRVL